MSRDKFDRNKIYPSINVVTQRIFKRETKGMTPEQLAEYEQNSRMQLLYAAYAMDPERRAKAIAQMAKDYEAHKADGPRKK